MSFDPIKFKFVPPRTIPPAAPTVAVEEAAGASSFGSEASSKSRAAALLRELGKLSAASRYLQEAVLARTAGLGVDIDPATAPDVYMALGRVYQSVDVPSSVDMPMFREMLAAVVGSQRADLILDPASSGLVVSPLQKADLQLVTNHIEKSFVEEPSFTRQLPLLLRPLMGDEVIFDYWSEGLKEYPIVRFQQLDSLQSAGTSNEVSRVDVGDELNATLSEAVQSWKVGYGRAYELLATPDPVEKALPQMLSLLSEQSVSGLKRVSLLLESLLHNFHLPKARELQSSLVGIIFPRLLAETGITRMIADRFKSSALDRVETGALKSLLGQTKGMDLGAVLNSSLTGLIRSQVNGAKREFGKTINLPAGLLTLASTMWWAKQEAQRKSDSVQKSFQKLLTQKLGSLGDQLETLGSLRSTSAMINVSDALWTKGASGKLTKLESGSTEQLETFGGIIRALRSPSGSTLAFQGEDLMITAPEVPSPSDEVVEVFQEGGVEVQSRQDLIRIRTEVFHV